MLIKRHSVLIDARQTVKKVSAGFVSAILLSTAAIAPAAFASDGPLVDVPVSVKFHLSDLEAEDGTQKVYDKLKRKAISSCMSDRAALRYLKQTAAECAANLVDQFVANADVPELTAFHEAQISEV